MAKRAGVSPADYLAYAQGTTIFTVDQNLEAFDSGSDMKHLAFAANDMAAFLKKSGLIKTDPDLSGFFDPSFVKAYAGK
jgi:NitT/TauT family transport system substrate-binding protein